MSYLYTVRITISLNQVSALFSERHRMGINYSRLKTILTWSPIATLMSMAMMLTDPRLLAEIDLALKYSPH
jgi:hypothetical protein